MIHAGGRGEIRLKQLLALVLLTRYPSLGREILLMLIYLIRLIWKLTAFTSVHQRNEEVKMDGWIIIMDDG